MEILNRGSFVPLENRERIDQLIYTARELATEMSMAENFQSSGQTNHQLGLEVWAGTEYVCRAHEEANIRNLFLSKFLERLREIEKQRAVQPMTPAAQQGEPTASQSPDPARIQAITTPSALSDPVPVPVACKQETVPAPHQEARDEYLGLVPQSAEIESGRPSYADECKPDFEREFPEPDCRTEVEAVAPVESEAREVGAMNPPPLEILPVESLKVETPVSEAGNQNALEADSNDESIADEVLPAESPTTSLTVGIDPIVLSEKEPYNFDSCTVTSVIHLFPDSDGIRKCVVSIKSHDFVPQIMTAEVANDNIAEDLRQKLETAFERYRTALPALAAEKIRKEKTSAKKRTTKPAEKANATAKSEDSVTAQTTPNPTAAQGQNSLFVS